MPLNIACVGPISEALGSVPGANLLLIRALLAAGHTVRLFYFERLNIPADLCAHSLFSFQCVPASLPERLGTWLARRSWNLTREALLATVYMPFRKRALRRAVARHDQSFELLLYLGYPAYFRLAAGKTISWYQGPLQSESNGIISTRETIIALGGWRKYLTLSLGYRLRLLTIRLCCVPSDIVICCSEWSKEQIASWHLRPKSIEVIPYPIDLELFRPAPKSTRTAAEPIFLWLGRAVPRKRLDLMIAAFELYRERYGCGRLLIVGGFSYLEGQARLIEQSSAREFIEFRKQIPRAEVSSLFSSVDVLVQPSELENFGSSVAEALASGVPSVVGATNGTKEFLGACGFIFSSYTPEAVCDAMAEAARPEHRQEHHGGSEFRAAARALAELYFDHRKIGDRLIEVVTA